MRLRLLTALAVLASMFVAAPSAQAADPYTCTGYPEPRVFLEAQSWWQTTPGENGTHQGHGHLGACVPHNQTLTGVVHIDWVVKLHENPGYLRELVGEIATDPNGSAGLKVLFDNTDPTRYNCPTADCTFIIPSDFDTSTSPVDGIQELQFRFRIKEPDGNTMRPALRFLADLQHGKTEDNYSRRSLNGYGWYTNAAYAYARLHSPLPTAPVSGTWTINASFEPTTDGVSLNTTHYMISVDPNFHGSPPSPGIVFYDADTACQPYVKTNCAGPQKQNFAIDTTRLANGPHKLLLKSDAKDPRGSTNSGILVVPFTVAN